MIIAGGILHLLVVALPLFCLGLVGTSIADPAVLIFLAGASSLYAGDAVTMQWWSSESRSPLNARAKRWATVMGGLLLLLFWACLVGVPGGRAWWACLVERAVTAPAGSWLQALGGALLLSGVALRAAAFRTLGRRFRTEIEVVDAVLVRKGVYRFLRHPSETGLLAASIGAALLLQSTIGFVVWCVALLPVTLERLSLEESALERRFGKAYERYAEEVGGLLPL